MGISLDEKYFVEVVYQSFSSATLMALFWDSLQTSHICFRGKTHLHGIADSRFLIIIAHQKYILPYEINEIKIYTRTSGCSKNQNKFC